MEYIYKPRQNRFITWCWEHHLKPIAIITMLSILLFEWVFRIKRPPTQYWIDSNGSKEQP